ncbi:beta-1,4 N-acetylgalactosaminyltransferase 2-like [Polypterus senegalus]|uniref:beta-1,4 N-acetylgalactosaminyltransferase 2-like n=1 Tax=Polypterus senegalus TaxID=55291 RepID=UPI0019628F69|nr:beta-1,4 N-acetylgalactosaminyltransferase 2-like [Polypterus senegalus]
MSCLRVYSLKNVFLLFLVLFVLGIVCIYSHNILYLVKPVDGADKWASPSSSETNEVKGREDDLNFIQPTLRKRVPCTCRQVPKVYDLPAVLKEEERSRIQARRTAEFKKHLSREASPLDSLLVALPNSPLRYPIQGVQVTPLQTISIPELSVHPPFRKHYKVSLKANLGIFHISSTNEENEVAGDKESEINIMASTKEKLNTILKSITYTSTVYRVNTADLVWFTFENYTAVFPILIRQHTIPKLNDPGEGSNISSLVTITTKTFLRYAQLKKLIASVRQFYPEIKIIVADDSFKPQTVDEPNVEHYIMPPGKGWFAGRNLAVSQVTTKYFLWVDDDFLFTENTKIEHMVQVMEDMPELDVVGGSVDGNTFQFRLFYEQGDEEGGCLHQQYGHFQTIPKFPHCTLSSGVVNFFLARTDQIQKVGFDPKLNRVAHSEFFIDGLGSLLVASCQGVTIAHQRREEVEPNVQAEYRKFRENTQAQVNMKLLLHYFKNQLKCYSRE